MYGSVRGGRERNSSEPAGVVHLFIEKSEWFGVVRVVRGIAESVETQAAVFERAEIITSRHLSRHE